jgi:hypothetical protein
MVREGCIYPRSVQLFPLFVSRDELLFVQTLLCRLLHLESAQVTDRENSDGWEEAQTFEREQTEQQQTLSTTEAYNR